ncbi:DNA-processing protein DprA [Nocardia gamkensis]|uniref:DNA-processing protein DprA n=1 Tax=Nocardia gamkensis TaxID=352869 RepID=UPI0037CB0D4E
MTEGGAVEEWSDVDRAALVALMRLDAGRPEWSHLTEGALEAGSPRVIWETKYPADLLGPNAHQHVFDKALQDVRDWRGGQYRLHTLADRLYPARLRSVRKAPPLVFTHGANVPDDAGVCVVGSRKVSTAGIRFARTVAEGLVDRGLTVVSGLAAGVDTAAHQAALHRGGRTVAVLGNGFSHVYPAANRELQVEIAARGMLLSHFLPERRPDKKSFPARNATMSAYAMATVIVEATEASGTRHQAWAAVGHGRPVIITETVATSTTWGGDLAGRPSVYVVDSADGALRAVDVILSERQRVDRMLADVLG